jgi:hypothetical protein
MPSPCHTREVSLMQLEPFFLFISTGPDCVSELRPQTYVLFIPQVIYEWWNDIDRKNRRTQKNLFHCHFFYQKSTWTDPDANPGLRATNSISHGAALNKTPWIGDQPITKASLPPQDRKKHWNVRGNIHTLSVIRPTISATSDQGLRLNPRGPLVRRCCGYELKYYCARWHVNLSDTNTKSKNCRLRQT